MLLLFVLLKCSQSPSPYFHIHVLLSWLSCIAIACCLTDHFPTQSQRTALHLAAFKGRVTECRHLVSAGASKEARNFNGKVSATLVTTTVFSSLCRRFLISLFYELRSFWLFF